MALKHNVIYFCRVFCTCKRLPQCGAQLPNCVHRHTHKYIPGILSLIIEFIELHARLTCKRERKNDVNDDCLNHGGLESASNYVYTCRNHGGQGGGVGHLLQNAGQCAAISQLFASLSPAATLATLSLHLIPAPATAPSPTSSHACPLSLSLSLIGEWRCDFSISHAVRPNAKNSHDTEATTTTATTPTTSNQDSRFKMMPESATCGSN